jgi:hypothetical protein
VSPGEFQSWLAQASRSGSPSQPGT